MLTNLFKTRNISSLFLLTGLFLLGQNLEGLESSTSAKPPIKTIGIVVPISLPAMDQIVSGYEQELTLKYPGPIKFIVKNSQGNTAILSAILQSFLDQNVDLIAPIGTDATQMALHMDQVRGKKMIPIIAIAADLPPNVTQTKAGQNTEITNVLDEISVPIQIQFIHAVLPSVKKITLIYSTDDRIFSDVKAAELAAKNNHIVIQKLMISNLSDLYTMKDHIASDTGAIFVLKDELVVSGMPTLAQVADKRHIPLIASDDGSVAQGAGFALGVREEDIGKLSADASAKILTGTPAHSIPSQVMTHYTVFINPQQIKTQQLDLNNLEKISTQQGFAHVLIHA